MLSQLIQIFDLEPIHSEKDSHTDENANKELLETTTLHQEQSSNSLNKGHSYLENKVKCYRKEEVRLCVLKDELCRFQLSGPLSHAILAQTLEPANLKQQDKCEDKWWAQHPILLVNT